MTSTQRDAGRLFARRMARLTLLYADHSAPDEAGLDPKVRAFLAVLVGLMWGTYDHAVEQGAFADDEQMSRIVHRLFQLGSGLDQTRIDWCRSVVKVASDFDQCVEHVIEGGLSGLRAVRHAV